MYYYLIWILISKQEIINYIYIYFNLQDGVSDGELDGVNEGDCEGE